MALRSRTNTAAIFGGCLLFGGLAITVGSVVGMSTSFGTRLPTIWQVSPPLWILLGLSVAAGGVAVIRSQSDAWIPIAPRSFESLDLYTKPDCPLCDEAKGVLDRYSEYLPTPREIDIRTDPDLTTRYGQHIPVVVIDGRERFRGRVSEVLLRRLIDAGEVPPGDGSVAELQDFRS